MADNQHSNSGRKFFDIARPGSVPENPTSKPVIVGHRPMQADPMLHRRRQELQKPPSEPKQEQTFGQDLAAEELLQAQTAPEVSEPVDSDILDQTTMPEAGLTGSQALRIDDGGQDISAPPMLGSVKSDTPQGHNDVSDTNEQAKIPQLATEEQAAALLQSTGLTQPKKRRSGGRKILIIVLTLLVIGAVVFDLVLLKQYVDLRG